MKIIQIMDTLTSTGGVNTFVFDLCIALKRAGRDVSLVGIMGDKSRENELAKHVKDAGISVYCLWLPSKRHAILHGVSELRKKVQQIAGNEPAICNLHLKLSVLIGGLATSGLKNICCVETYHSRYSKYWLERKLMSPRISKYICCSDSAKEEFISRFNVKGNRVISIPNGIDTEELHECIAGRKKCFDTRTVFLSVGRFTDQKNMHVTVAAFSQIDSFRAVYKLIGQGPLKDQAVEAANRSKTVQFLGTIPREDVIYELDNADMVVIPSLWEGLSIFMLEAMAMGCPLMLSDVESLRAVVHEEALHDKERWRRCNWGYLVSTSDVDAYRMAAEDYLSHKETKNAMSKEILIMAESYSIKSTTDKYIKVYDDITQNT